MISNDIFLSFKIRNILTILRYLVLRLAGFKSLRQVGVRNAMRERRCVNAPSRSLATFAGR